MKPLNWHKFVAENGMDDQWVDLTHVLAARVYRGGSYHPCNGGSILELPFGSTVAVQMAPDKVMALVDALHTSQDGDK